MIDWVGATYGATLTERDFEYLYYDSATGKAGTLG